MRKLFSLFAALTLSVGLWAADPGTFAQLQSLIDGTASGGTVTLTQDYTYEGTAVYIYSNGGVKINKSLTIDLNGHTISGNGMNRCFHLSGGTSTNPTQVTIKNGTLTNGYTQCCGGAISVGEVEQDYYVTATIENCTISNCKSEYNSATKNGMGGGIYVTNKSTCTVSGGTFFKNTAIFGGAISSAGKCTVTSASFTENSTQYYGGAISNTGTTCTVTGGEFTGNTATTNGGAIYNEGTTCTVSGGTFSKNTVTSTSNGIGGAIYNAANYSCTITGASFSQNTAANAGGAVANYGTGSIDGASFSQNTAPNGGAILNRWYGCTVKNATFTENKATTGVGGAIYNRATSGTCGIEGTTSFTGNTATTNGGAIYNDAGATCTVSGVSFSLNTAAYGGAIYNAANSSSTITIKDNATFTENTAANAGGAIANYGTGSIDGASFTKNTAVDGGGAILNRWYAYTIKNATFTENKANGTSSDNGFGGAIYNRATNGACSIEGTTSFTGNTATTNGGAIYSDGTTCTVSGASFTENTATTNGGAIFNGGTNCTVSDASFSQNSANCGGAIQNEGTLNLTAASGKSIEITNNHATKAEGGVSNWATTNISGKVIIKDNYIDVEEGEDIPSNFSPWNESPVNITGAMTGSDIYFELVDNSDTFTDGTLTSGYSTKSGSTKANTFFHYDGPDTWFANMKNGEIVLDPAGTFAHLQALIDNTPAGGTLTLTMNHTYEGTEVYDAVDGGVLITKSLTIDLNGHTIDGNQKNRCFQLQCTDESNPISVIIKNGTITNGCSRYRGGGAICIGTTVTVPHYVTATIDNCTISNSEASGYASYTNYGGGIFVCPSSTCTITNGSILTNNSASSSGGAIFCKGTCIIDNAKFTNNSSRYGGAIRNDETCTIKNATFTENNSGSMGGAIYVEDGKECTINNATFSKNSATEDGGAIDSNGGICTITDVSFTENSATGSGGAIMNWGTCTINSGTFTKNSANLGGAIDNAGVTCDITDAIFSENSAVYGGAIQNDGWEGNLNLTAAEGKSIVIENNHATEAEGGVSNWTTINISGKVIIKDNYIDVEEGEDIPSNFSPWFSSTDEDWHPINIVGDMTDSNIYFELVDENDVFCAGTLTSGYSEKSGSTEPDAFFHYDGPTTIGDHNVSAFLNAAGEIFVGGLYTRDVANGSWGTLCLPWASVKLEGGNYYKVLGTKHEEYGVALTPIEAPDQLEAGYPYVFLATSEQIKVYYDPETAEEAPVDAGNHIIGSFEGCYVPAGQYIIYNNLLYKSSGSNVIDEYRAYFDVEGMDPFVQSQAPARVVFFGGRQAPTSLGGEADRLRGRKVIKVIENGQFRIVRDGKTYNAQGIEL